MTEFLRRHLSERGLEYFIERIPVDLQTAPSRISSEEIGRLLDAPLPLIGAVACYCKRNVASSAGETAHPVVYLPLAALIEECGAEEAIRRASTSIRTVKSAVRFAGCLSIAIDRWSGAVELETLIGSLHHLVEQFSVDRLSPWLRVIGPSTVEIIQMCEDQDTTLDECLSEMSALGVWRINGGTHIHIHAAAARLGLEAHVGQDVSFIFEALRLHPAPGHRRSAEFTKMLEERFVGDLLEIRDQMLETGQLRTWFPWARTGEDLRHLDPTGDFGLPFLRCVALARILLPSETTVRAPLSLFGRLLAEVALEFGADELGFVAVDGETARKLGIHKLSEIIDAGLTDARFSVAGGL